MIISVCWSLYEDDIENHFIDTECTKLDPAVKKRLENAVIKKYKSIKLSWRQIADLDTSGIVNFPIIVHAKLHLNLSNED